MPQQRLDRTRPTAPADAAAAPASRAKPAKPKPAGQAQGRPRPPRRQAGRRPPPGDAPQARDRRRSPPAAGGAPRRSTPATQAPARSAETAASRRRPAAPRPPHAGAKAKPAKVKPAKAPAKPTREQPQAKVAGPRPGRRARLRMTRIDPWSVMKTAFLLSIALGIVTVVSVLMVWSVLDAADVWASINQTVQDVVGGQDASNFDIEDYIGTRRVVGFTMIVAAVDVVLLTAIATLGAFLYNMSASLLGGIEVTLAEDN